MTKPIRNAATCVLSATLALLARQAMAEDAPAPAAEAPPAVAPAPAPAPVNAAAAEAALQEYLQQEKTLLSQRAAIAAYHADQGMRLRDAGRLADAIDHLRRAVDYAPDNRDYRRELQRTQAMAGTSADAGALAGRQAGDEFAVKQQLLLQEAQSRLEEGRRQLSAGAFDAAERSFEQAAIRLESLPFADPGREAQLQEAKGLAEEARQRRRAAEVQAQSLRNQAAAERSQAMRSAGIQREREQIDAQLARAERARERRDYDRAILLCETVLKINRAEPRALSLLSRCRRERHDYIRQITADRWDEEHKLLSEQIRKAMLPQVEIVRFTMDPNSSLPARAGGAQEEGAQEAAWVKAINNQLEQPVTLDFQETQVDEVIKFLQKVTGVNIIVDPRVMAASPPPVTLKADRMKLAFVLSFVMKLTQLTYVLRDDAIYITNAEGAQSALATRLYDIRDLMHSVPNYPGPELEVPQPGGSVVRILPPVEPEVQPSATEFIDIIQRVVAPNTWAQPGVAAPSEYNGSLIVTQSADVHKQIDALLRSLRNQRGKQIHIKCKFLTIENSVLEEIGVNWQNFTGNPRAAAGQPGSVPLPGQGTTGGVPPDPGVPANIGAYFGDAGTQILTAGQLNNRLLGYTTDRTLPNPDFSSGDGLSFQTQTWQVNTNLYASAVLRAVEKERRGNVLFEPSCTIFNGQQAHIVHMNQQAYIGDYDVVQGQYDPIISVLSYGTVLDVQGIASADNKYITMTVKPTHTRVRQWRRFGGTVDDGSFAGGAVAPPSGDSIAGEAPLLIPEVIYQSVRTSVTIPDGGSLVLSSMTDGQSLRSHAGIPFLSHIPFLGRLFSANGRAETESSVTVIVQGDILLFDEIESNL